MKSIIAIICTIISGAALIWGGATDFKRREIPNGVPIILLLTGFLDIGHILPRLAVMVLIGFSLWLSCKLTKQEVPGGDFKLICALAFSAGLLNLLSVMFCAGVLAVVVGFITHKPIKRNIPLCTYVAPAYVILNVVLLLS